MSTIMQGTPVDSTDAIATVRALNEQYIRAARTNDAGWFQQHMSEDVVVIFGNGRRVTKSGFLQAMRHEPKSYKYLGLENVTLRAFGDTVQVDADAPWELSNGTQGVSRYIDTYARIDARWQVISAQITWLPQAGG
jgi:ketosteroid isomerase-like protein